MFTISLRKTASLLLVTSLLPAMALNSSSTAIAAEVAPTSLVTPTVVVEPFHMPDGHLNINLNDLKFILDQIKIAEAHAARTAVPVNTAESSIFPVAYDDSSTTRCLLPVDISAANSEAYGYTGLSNTYTYSTLSPWGLREVNGECNNIAKSTSSEWGSADKVFPRIAPRVTSTTTDYTGVFAPNAIQRQYESSSASVVDNQPRIISNIISDQSTANPAAQAAALRAIQLLNPAAIAPTTTNAINATTGAVSSVYDIPNITPDLNTSAGYDSWFTAFGQFFDHGLDLIPKAGSSVTINILPGDSLYVAGGQNRMTLTRAACDSSVVPLPVNCVGVPTGESKNTTSPYIDQSQTYGSHASQNVLIREYSFTSGVPVSTGGLFGSSDGGLPTWKDMKRQAANLGFLLSDYDVNSVPYIATNQYGKFVPGPNGFPMILFTLNGQYKYVEGNPASLVPTSLPGGWKAVDSGHAFINDMTATAGPFSPISGLPLTADADSVINSVHTAPAFGLVNGRTDFLTYDNEALDSHFIAGDGRVNENIGLAAIHQTFHSEHNTVVADIQNLLTNSPQVTDEFRAEWKIDANNWNGERLYQAARFVMESEYLHIVFDEFARRISPQLPAFALSGYSDQLNANITAEFASAVYRVGHSMLNEEFPRVVPGTIYDPVGANQSLSLIDAFTTPVQYQSLRPAGVARASYSAGTYTYTMQINERLPEVNSVVSVAGLADNSFNLKNLVVTSTNPVNRTFSSNTYFDGVSASAVAAPTLPAKVVNIISASGNGTTVTYTISPSTPAGGDFIKGQIVSIVGFGPAALNIANATITSSTANTFTVTAAVNASVPSTAFAYATRILTNIPSSVAATNGAQMGSVTINDNPSGTPPYSSADAAASIVGGMMAQRGNEIDEFVTDALRNNLLGQPLDLAALNITRGRDVGLPTLNQFRNYLTTHNIASLPAYPSWSAFIAALRNPESGINFLAAYGKHTSIVNAVGTTAKRAAAAALINSALVVPIAGPQQDAYNFMNSLGGYTSQSTGLNDIDLWIGGLAENPSVQPGLNQMFGPTFNYVFQDQMSKLQNGDRFYYLSRLAGMNLGEEIQTQKFNEMVKRNAPASAPLSSPSFSMIDCAYSGYTAPNSSTPTWVPAAFQCAGNTTLPDSTVVHAGADNVFGFVDPRPGYVQRVTGGSGDDTILGSTGNDFLSGGLAGADLISGGSGDDVILGGPGEDIIKGNYGNDVINAGDSIVGDLADGGSGNDFIHTGNQGANVIAAGEAGDDFLQGGIGPDTFIGGDGNDWVEGGDSVDTLDGDNGLNGGGGQLLSGGDDVLDGGFQNDLVAGGPGNDILMAGNGFDVLDGGTGFDWVNYSNAVRPVWVDLSGLAPAIPALVDGVIDVEALSGSPADDIFYGSATANLELEGASGNRGELTIQFPVGSLRVEVGMFVVGVGIAPHTQVVGVSRDLKTITLDAELLSNVSGSIKFTTHPLDNISAISGLSTVLTGAAGYNAPVSASGVVSRRNVLGTSKYYITLQAGNDTIPVGATVALKASGTTDAPNGAIVTSVHGRLVGISFTSTALNDAAIAANTYDAIFTPTAQFIGGNIILGGAGNDAIHLYDGNNVVDGNASLNVCLLVRGGSYVVGANMRCQGSLTNNGFNSMSPLAAPMENRTISPADVEVIREITTSSAIDNDTVFYNGPSTNYSYSVLSGSETMTSLNQVIYQVRNVATGAVDTLRNIEALVFTDKSCSIGGPSSTCALIAQPDSPTATYTSGHSATITISAQRGDIVPDRYIVSSNVGGFTCEISGATGSCIISGLLSGTTYRFSAVAIKDAPLKFISATSTLSSPITVEGAISGLTPVTPPVTPPSNGGGSGGGGFVPSAPAAPALKTKPVVEWNPVKSLKSTDLISSDNLLNARVLQPTSIPGRIVYNVIAGSTLPVGTSEVTATFIPEDQNNYDVVATSVFITVVQGEAKLTISSTNFTYDGNPKGVVIAAVPSDAQYTVTYNGSTEVPRNAGTYLVSALAKGAVTPVQSTMVIAKAVPALSWSTNAVITSKLALQAAQLNAKASVPGSFTYSSKAGSKLPLGTQVVKAIFTPADSANYSVASIDFNFEVKPAKVSSLTAGITAASGIFTASQVASMKSALVGVESLTIARFVKPTSNKAADLAKSQSSAAALKRQIQQMAPWATIAVKAMGSKINGQCKATANSCALIEIVKP